MLGGRANLGPDFIVFAILSIPIPAALSLICCVCIAANQFSHPPVPGVRLIARMPSKMQCEALRVKWQVERVERCRMAAY